MNEPMTEPYYCPECDDPPPGWDHYSPAWRYCPVHGEELATAAELEMDAEQARADALCDERFVDGWEETNAWAWDTVTRRAG